MTKEEMAQKIAEAIQRDASGFAVSVEVLESDPAVVCVEAESGDLFFTEVQEA